MTFTETDLQGCHILEPDLRYDERGYFMETFNERNFRKGIGHAIRFVQDNQSTSASGVLRGLHYQRKEHAQAKLVRVLQGEILDVAVDLRPGSATYGSHIAVLLSDTNHRQLFIPKGFAHGFLVLSDTATVFYKCDNFYNQAFEAGIIYNDPLVGIDWGMPADKFIVSEKDKGWPGLQNAEKVW